MIDPCSLLLPVFQHPLFGWLTVCREERNGFGFVITGFVGINDSVPESLYYIIGVFFPQINSVLFFGLWIGNLFSSFPLFLFLGLFLSPLMNHCTRDELRVYCRFYVLHFLFLLSSLASCLRSFSLLTGSCNGYFFKRSCVFGRRFPKSWWLLLKIICCVSLQSLHES